MTRDSEFPSKQEADRSARTVFIQAIQRTKSFVLRNGLFFSLSLLISVLTTVSYYNCTKEYPHGSILRVLLGTAQYPFSARVLIYKISYFFSAALSVNVYHVFFVLRVLTILLCLYVLRQFLKEFRINALLLPLLFAYSTSFSFFDGYWYPTDFTEILFFSLMLMLISREKTVPFGLIFFIALLNRESAVFILPFFVLTYSKRKKFKEMVMLGSLIIFGVVIIRLFILPADMSVFSTELIKIKLHSNLSALKGISTLFSGHPQEKSSYFFWKLVSFSGFLYLFAASNFQKIPRILRHYILSVGPLNVIFALLVGNLKETRIFYPLIPALMLSSCVIVKRMNVRTSLLPVLVSFVVFLFFMGNGYYLKENSEFAVKSESFKIEEFRKVKSGILVFDEKMLDIRRDRVVVDFTKLPNKYLFLDSCVNVASSQKKPKEVLAVLENGLSFKRRFREDERYYYACMKRLQFEMKNPSVQTEPISRLIILFEGNPGKELIGRIKWEGFCTERSDQKNH